MTAKTLQTAWLKESEQRHVSPRQTLGRHWELLPCTERRNRVETPCLLVSTIPPSLRVMKASLVLPLEAVTSRPQFIYLYEQHSDHIF